MAELLIKAIDAIHSNKDKDRRGCYKRGDVVVVMPDGHEWGKEECFPKFVVVKIPGLSVEAGKKYTESDYDLSDPKGERVLTRRKYKLKLDSLPGSIKQQLNKAGETTVVWGSIKGYVENKVLGVTE